MLRKYGVDVVRDLESLEWQPKKWTREELEGVRSYYSRKLAELDAGIAPNLPKPQTMVSLFFGDT
jgi:hypothetical protein